MSGKLQPHPRRWEWCSFEWTRKRRYIWTTHRCKLKKRHRGQHRCFGPNMDMTCKAVRPREAR
jgi:hypothetical protein